MVLEALIVFLVAFTGGALPLFFRWSDRLLHASLALSTGIFLGAVFFHLLPAIALGDSGHGPTAGGAHAEEVAAGLEASQPAISGDPPAALRAPHGHDVVPWLFVLIGVLGVYLVESLGLRTHDHDVLHRHRGVSYAALVGLSLHSITTGLAYPAVATGSAWTVPLFIAIVSHKGLEAFSLTTVFQLAEFGRGAIFGMVLLFSLVTPAGILAGALLADHLHAGGAVILSALAAGTFLYVCLGELLPEVFHHREDILAKIGLMTLGIGAMLLLHGAGA